jgi:hypothetical protein
MVHHNLDYTVWGSSRVPNRKAAVHNPALTLGKAPLDRSATWLVHMPKKKGSDNPALTPNPSFPNYSANNTTTRSPAIRKHEVMVGSLRSNVKDPYQMTPEMRQHVANVARSIFSENRKKGEADKGRIIDQHSSFSLPLSLSMECDVASFVEQFEQHIAAQKATTTLRLLPFESVTTTMVVPMRECGFRETSPTRTKPTHGSAVLVVDTSRFGMTAARHRSPPRFHNHCLPPWLMLQSSLRHSVLHPWTRTTITATGFGAPYKLWSPRNLPPLCCCPVGAMFRTG